MKKKTTTDEKITTLRITMVGIYIIATLFLTWNISDINKLETRIDQLEEGEPVLDFQSISDLVDKIERDCGATFITKKYGQEDWFIFKQVCKEEGYCKSGYLKLEDCLK